MTEQVAQRRSARGRDEFFRLAEPFRREILVHCARLLGSFHDAEDLVQETYLRAWRSYAAFEGRSSLRSWLYRIATNACMTAIDERSRRPIPVDLQPDELEWPAAVVEQRDADPEVLVASRDRMRSAIGIAMEHLEPRPRAVLMLRDVLGWSAADVAELLDTSSAAVHSMLRRARAQVARVAENGGDAHPVDDRGTRSMVEAYAAAFERGDVPSIVKLLTKDAVFVGAGFPDGITGPEAIEEFVARCPCLGSCRVVPFTVGSQHAIAIYKADGRAYSIEFVTAGPAGLEAIVVHEGAAAFAKYGMPQVIGVAA